MTDVQRVPQEPWPVTTVGRAMTAVDRVETVLSTMSVADALRLMSAPRRHELPVMDDGRLVGLLSQPGIERYFQMRRELGLGTPSKPRETVTRRSA
jgi:CBS domain-containing protein